MAKSLPSQEVLLQLLRYEPETGKLLWKARPISEFPNERTFKSWNTRCANKEAFTATTEGGYMIGAINNNLFYAHRVIFKMVHGTEPPQIDHINGQRPDNREVNLREATDAVNRRNAARFKNNTSGCTGVSWTERDQRWVAKIQNLDGENVILGNFRESEKEKAMQVRKSAEQDFGYHPNHGRG